MEHFQYGFQSTIQRYWRNLSSLHSVYFFQYILFFNRLFDTIKSPPNIKIILFERFLAMKTSCLNRNYEFLYRFTNQYKSNFETFFPVLFQSYMYISALPQQKSADVVKRRIRQLQTSSSLNESLYKNWVSNTGQQVCRQLLLHKSMFPSLFDKY